MLNLPKPPVFFLAYGTQGRLPALTHPKALLSIRSREHNEESILERTVWMVISKVPHGDLYLVAPELDVWDQFATKMKLDHLHAGVPAGKGVVHTIRGLGGVPGLYLLADVVFSRRAIEIIATAVSTRTTTFFGRRNASIITGKPHGELFGFYIAPESVENNFGRALDTLHYIDQDQGKLWDLLAQMQSLDATSASATHFALIDDYTDDIDTPEDLAVILPRLREFVGADHGGRP